MRVESLWCSNLGFCPAIRIRSCVVWANPMIQFIIEQKEYMNIIEHKIDIDRNGDNTKNDQWKVLHIAGWILIL